MKQCSKCKEWKDENEFNKCKKVKDGLQSQCRECNNKNGREWHWGNKEEKNKKDREYNEAHKEEINQRSIEYYWDHREERNEKCGEYNNSPLEYNSKTKIRKEIGLYEEVKKSKDGNIEVKCAYDGDWFEPTKVQIQARLAAINGEGNVEGECKLYCSNKCKENCPTYNQTWYEKGQKPATSREVQPALRKMVFARDEYTCQKCGLHRDELEVGIHCHHIDGIRWNPLESADMDTCITLCEDHHNEAHDEPGCRYNDLKCPY